LREEGQYQSIKPQPSEEETIPPEEKTSVPPTTASTTVRIGDTTFSKSPSGAITPVSPLVSPPQQQQAEQQTGETSESIPSQEPRPIANVLVAEKQQIDTGMSGIYQQTYKPSPSGPQIPVVLIEAKERVDTGISPLVQQTVPRPRMPNTTEPFITNDQGIIIGENPDYIPPGMVQDVVTGRPINPLTITPAEVAYSKFSHASPFEKLITVFSSALHNPVDFFGETPKFFYSTATSDREQAQQGYFKNFLGKEIQRAQEVKSPWDATMYAFESPFVFIPAFITGLEGINAGIIGASKLALGMERGAVIGTKIATNANRLIQIGMGYKAIEGGIKAQEQGELQNYLYKQGLYLGAMGIYSGMMGREIKLPKYQEVTYFKETGEVNIRNVYNILGKDVRSPFYKAATGERGLDFFEHGMPETSPEPPGIAQGPRWRPTEPREVNIIHQGELSYVEPIISERWQPQTGIPEPYVKTGYELTIPPPKPILRPTPGPIVPYDPIFQVADPNITEINKTLDFLGKNWQPKTGIPFPKEIKPIVTPVENIKSPLDIIFKPKPAEPIITKITLDAEGNLVGTKYGLTEPTTRQWQPQTGTFEQPPRTGKELGTTVFPKPTPYITPGRLAIYEPMLELFGGFESGQTLQTEGLIRLAPTRKTFTLKDIIKPTEKPIEVSQGQRGGQETILIMEEPKIETKTISDLITEQEQIMMGEQRQEQISLTKQKTIQSPYEVFKPMTVQKQDTRSLSLFMPMTETKQKELTLSGLRQEQERMTKPGVIPLSLTDTLSLSLQGSMTDVDHISKQIQDSIVITEGTITDRTRKITERTIPERNNPFEEQPGKPRPPILSEDEEDLFASSEPKSYVLELRSRQFQNGKRIDDRTYRPHGNYSFNDALSLGMHINDTTEKASFELEPSDKKPMKLGKHIPDWSTNISQFTQTKENRWVELPQYRIDSPGERAAITMKGIQARMRR
jgi:hypothetical protein